MNATVATCSAERWTFNSLNQSPCVVGSVLGSLCRSRGLYIIPPLPPRAYYVGPWARESQATPCLCNTVFYSLISACAHCQGREFIGWSEWAFNCTTVYSGVFPRDLPRGVAVPAWAYMEFNATDIFNPLLAQGFGGTESAGTPVTPSTASLPTNTAQPAPVTTIIATSSSTPTAPTEPATTTQAASLDGVGGNNSASTISWGTKLYFILVLCAVASLVS